MNMKTLYTLLKDHVKRRKRASKNLSTLITVCENQINPLVTWGKKILSSHLLGSVGGTANQTEKRQINKRKINRFNDVHMHKNKEL